MGTPLFYRVTNKQSSLHVCDIRRPLGWDHSLREAFPGSSLQRGEAAAQQAGDVHLADADSLRDLALAQPRVEPQLDDRAFAVRERLEQLTYEQPIV